METHSIDNVIWIANIVVFCVLYGRLVWNGLSSRYQAFSWLIAFLALRSTVLLIIQHDFVLFFYVWLISEPFVVLAYTLTVFEAYTLALRRYRGIQTATRRIFNIAIVVASLVSVLSIFPDLQFSKPAGEDWVLLVNVIRRGVYTSLLAFLVLLVSFVSIFPVRLSRNAIVHVVIFFISFLFFASRIFLVNLVGADLAPALNTVAAVIGLGCGIAWCFLLTPSGENVEASMPNGLSEQQAAVLLNKLKEVNDALSDSGKRL